MTKTVSCAHAQRHGANAQRTVDLLMEFSLGNKYSEQKVNMGMHDRITVDRYHQRISIFFRIKGCCERDLIS